MYTMAGKAARARRRGPRIARGRGQVRRPAGPGSPCGRPRVAVVLASGRPRLGPGSAADRYAAGQAGRRRTPGCPCGTGFGPHRPPRGPYGICERLQYAFAGRSRSCAGSGPRSRLGYRQTRASLSPGSGHRCHCRGGADSVSRALAGPGNGYRRPWRTMRFS